jgi:hypothetical protein
MQYALENTHEVLAFRSENLRRVRCALAPHRGRGWRVLLKVFASAFGLSGGSREARRGTKDPPGSGTNLFRCPKTGRRCKMSAAHAVLPYLWAAAPPRSGKNEPLEPNLAFYRKYTEGILRRYVHLSMESGRVPSLLGQEMFRGRVTSYRVRSFDDVVIFVHDVRKCLETLAAQEQLLLVRIAIQGHTHCDAAALMGMTQRAVVRRYGHAVDRLTKIFVDAKMLDLQISCQEAEIEERGVSY